MSSTRRLAWPVVGSLAVLVLSPALELATGQEVFSTLSVLFLLVILWPLTRLSRKEMGLRWGSGEAYLVAFGSPIAVAALLVGAALLAGQVAVTDPASKIGRRFLLVFIATLIGALITEEGFFRGWLWGSLERAGLRSWQVLVWTSTVFCLWHIHAAVMEPSFKLPAAMVPVYLANVLLLGLNWGLLRAASGSVVVPTCSHGIWNAFAYVLFGYGTKSTALGISAINLLDPERGLAGLVLNTVALVFLWRRWRKRTATRVVRPG